MVKYERPKNGYGGPPPVCYIPEMTSKLKDVMTRAESWPEEAQDELAEIAREIETALQGGAYHPSSEELAGIERGLEDARQGRFATAAEIEAVFAKHRP